MCAISCFSGLRTGFVDSALIVVGFLLAAPASALTLLPDPPPTHTNSIGMEFVLIPAGTFQMGCSSEAEDCADDEKPRHQVRISSAN